MIRIVKKMPINPKPDKYGNRAFLPDCGGSDAGALSQRPGYRVCFLAMAEQAPRPSRRPLRGLLRMRLMNIGAR
ncbi:hypothetical protein ABH984_001554 [Bradyrhizobium ottawaense]